MVEVVVGALVRDGRVLLALRSTTKHAYPGVWDLPGGVAEAGESELDTLARELHEELGVRVGTAMATHLCHVELGTPQAPVRLSAWLVHEWEGDPANLAPEEHDDLAWFDLDDRPALAHPAVDDSLRQAPKSR